MDKKVFYLTLAVVAALLLAIVSLFSKSGGGSLGGVTGLDILQVRKICMRRASDTLIVAASSTALAFDYSTSTSCQ